MFMLCGLSEMDAHHLRSVQDIGGAVGVLRYQAKLSQIALGQATGLSRMPVYRLEAGQDISLRSFLALLQALKRQLALRPGQAEPLRAADLKATFAHLQAEDDALQELQAFGPKFCNVYRYRFGCRLSKSQNQGRAPPTF